ncbi:hypothetical protein CcaverHIS641_0402810 [Cutaneotrichosporon cavernicola]|nr:hypothetical protein CcaverHIS641_0402810 [Cutaneotrichosporon cavernicola]
MTDSIPSPGTYSSATAVSGVDARIADLEAQLRALQERLEPELRTTKSMPFLRRLQRKDDRQAKEFMALVEAKEFMALVEAKRNGKPIRDKEERPSARALLLGRAGASTIDLSHLEVKDKEKRRWNICSCDVAPHLRPTGHTTYIDSDSDSVAAEDMHT